MPSTRTPTRSITASGTRRSSTRCDSSGPYRCEASISTDPWNVPGAPAGDTSAKRPSTGGRNAQTWILVGIALGIVGGGVAGFFEGLLMTTWMDDGDCCGLEGLLAPMTGVIGGVIVGAITGALVGHRFGEGGSLAIHRLLAFVLVGHLLIWLLSNFYYFDYEDLVGTILFSSLGFLLPLLVWAFKD